ncbi:MAG TPA: hypothetical protein VFV72_04970 [Candidatus Limnocylindrales bacterium]|nr:hypothetical protein [Candidatus Limnocylindrales bacterium]
MIWLRSRRWVAAGLAACVAVLPSLVVAADNAIINATVTVAPIVVTVSISATQAAVGERVQARATVTNLGPSAVGPIELTLRANSDGIRIQGDALKTTRRLAAGKEWGVSWNVCGRVAGAFVLLATARLGQASIDSEAHVLTVTSRPGHTC